VARAEQVAVGSDGEAVSSGVGDQLLALTAGREGHMRPVVPCSEKSEKKSVLRSANQTAPSVNVIPVHSC
jgi:hypothetical protein